MKKIIILLAALLLMVIMGCGSSAPATLLSLKAITAFSLDGTDGTINEAGKTITVTKPFGTNVTALVATFTTTGASVKVGSTIQVSGTTANDFTSHVDYMVTAADNSSVNYTVTVTVAASAVNLPKSGQTVCYDTPGAVIACAGTGQDGEMLKGATWPTPRFTDHGDQTITDNLTGLMWTENGNAPGPAGCSPGVDKTWQQGLDYAKCLNTNNYLGYNDWRMPNVNELESLVHDGQTNTAAWLNIQGFNSVQSDWYWSSTTCAGGTGNAWVVIMDEGFVDGGFKTHVHYVWPVRAGQNGLINLPKTGQAVCYDTLGTVITCTNTGQDGDLQKGVIWPSPRFIDNGDQTITDNLTGLIWTQNGNAPGPVACTPGVAKTWQQGLDYAKCLNTNNYLDYNDWRLPNRKELRSLANYAHADTSAWLNIQGFNSVQPGWYWSSTTYANDAVFAWTVFMDVGGVGCFGKSMSGYVWPVRAGQ